MNAHERAALIRNREGAERLNRGHRPSGPDFSPEAIGRHAATVAPRTTAGPLGGYQYGTMPTNPAADRERRKLEADAALFQENARMERLLQWEQKDDPRFDALDPRERIALGLYRRQRDGAKEVRRG